MKRFLFFCFLLVACGGSAGPAESTTPASGGSGGGTSAPPEMSPENAQHATPSNTYDGNTRTIQMNNAHAELSRAEAQVNAAMSDCAQACRALESMERAAEHLCALDGGSECGRARERLEAARQRVRASCGGCR